MYNAIPCAPTGGERADITQGVLVTKEVVGGGAVDGSVTDEVARRPRHRLQGNMGLPHLMFTVVAYNAPLGQSAAILPLAIALGAGLGSPLLFLALGVVFAIFAVGYTAMANILPRAGAFYAFVAAGLGRPLGVAASFVAVLTYVMGVGFILPFSSLSTQTLVTGFGGPDIDWWVWALIFAAGMGVLGFVKIDFSARVLGVLVACEVLLVVVYDVVVAAKGGATGHLGVNPFDPSALTTSGAAIAIVFAIACFGGFESTAIYRDEVRSPRRTIPRATFLAVLVITLFYTVGSWLLIEAYGEENAVSVIGADPVSALLNSMGQYLGGTMQDIASVLLITSLFASLVALHNVIVRYIFNLGADGVLPNALGQSHLRLGSPHRASLTLSALTVAYLVIAAVVAGDPQSIFTVLAGVQGYGFVVLLFMAAVGIAAYLIRNRGTSTVGVWTWGIAPSASVVITGAILVLVTVNLDLLTGGSAMVEIVTIALLASALVLGVAVALVFRSRRPDTYQRIGRQD